MICKIVDFVKNGIHRLNCSHGFQCFNCVVDLKNMYHRISQLSSFLQSNRAHPEGPPFCVPSNIIPEWSANLMLAETRRVFGECSMMKMHQDLLNSHSFSSHLLCGYNRFVSRSFFQSWTSFHGKRITCLALCDRLICSSTRLVNML